MHLRLIDHVFGITKGRKGSDLAITHLVTEDGEVVHALTIVHELMGDSVRYLHGAQELVAVICADCGSPVGLDWRDIDHSKTPRTFTPIESCQV